MSTNMIATWNNINASKIEEFKQWAAKDHDACEVVTDSPTSQLGRVSGHKVFINWSFMYTWDKLKEAVTISASDHGDAILSAIENQLGPAAQKV